ncbi:MAG: Crp/Fnr family transcriptional regulator [Desulfobulbaceae bacterium]|uniref:Crp/Fnr family transcriptional regulator n=1 Tax=Candidatus Desulfobia pelagia TaxID=2841692 RepID=A0A8J6NEN1_9BACT|nr:Crp/Fnr family transcriptional regulator [Candidatus Desulfobia pelagia]
MLNIDPLANNSLFRGLNENDHNELSRISVSQEYSRGQTIFLEGQDGAGFYLVTSGLVKIYKLSLDGKEQILHILGPGEPFAEVALFAGSTYPANAMAIEKSSVVFFPRKAFSDLISKRPSLALNMLATLSLRLRQFANMVEALSLKEVPGRLAAYILLENEERGKNGDIKLPIAKSQLASLLGTIPETLSRILAKMTKQGIVTATGSSISILDMEKLQELADGETRLS